MNYVRYAPSTKQLATLPLGGTYLELWEGVPQLRFSSANARDGSGTLVYRSDHNYIWIAPRAAAALQNDSTTLLDAFCHKRLDGKIDAWWVDISATQDLDAAVQCAQTFNEKTLREIATLRTQIMGDRT